MPSELEALASELQTQGVTSHIVTAEGGPGGPKPETTDDVFTPDARPVNNFANAQRKVTVEITEPNGKTTKWELFPSKYQAEPLGARDILRCIDKNIMSRYQGSEIRRVA